MKTFIFIRDMLVLLAVSSSMCAALMFVYWWVLRADL